MLLLETPQNIKSLHEQQVAAGSGIQSDTGVQSVGEFNRRDTRLADKEEQIKLVSDKSILSVVN